MMSAASLIRPGWRAAWSHRRFRKALGWAVGTAVAVVAMLPRFFRWIEERPGMHVDDPLLEQWGPIDLSGFTFAVLYATVAVVLIAVAARPLAVLRGLWAYVLLLLLRMAAMAAFTLEPPATIIPLRDPIIQQFYPGEMPFLKDLFFSGHTATLVLMALLAPKGAVRWAAVAGAALVGGAVLGQHVHWTVDVLVAVPAAWAAWMLAGYLLRYLRLLPWPERIAG